MGKGDRPTKWQQKREASYEVLLQSAMAAFQERGYAATRVSDIVAGTGYTSGTFYLHFKNKSDCFWQVLEYHDRRRAGWQDFLDALDPATTSLGEVLGRAISTLAASTGGRGGWTLVMSEHIREQGDDPATQERYQGLFRQWHEGITAFVGRLQEKKWADPSRDPAVVGLEVLSFAEGMQAHASLFRPDPDLARRALIDGMVRLIGPAPGG